MTLNAIALGKARTRQPLGWVRNLLQLRPAGLLGLFCVSLVIFAAIAAPIIAPNDPTKSNLDQILQPPSWTAWFGTDVLGRDMFSRIVWGSRISLLVSITAVMLGHGVGATVGVMSAYFGGKFDLIVQRVMDALQSFPLLIMAIAIVAFLGPSVTNVVLSLGIVIIPSSSRVIRSAALVVKEQQFIEAAHVIGVSNTRIMFRHVFPNVLPPIMVLGSASLGTAVLVEASLSFLGLGPPPPTPTWGGMLSASAAQFMEIAPWTAIYPGIAISITVLGFNLLGDSLRDLWDPRLRGSR